MINNLYYFNNIALTGKRVPLPTDSTERLLFFYDNVYFRFTVKHIPEFIDSVSGRLYLTSYRLIYIPAMENAFHSFFVPINKIFAVESETFLECLCDNNYVGMICLNFKSFQDRLFYQEIRKRVEETVMEIDSAFIEDDEEELPYYSDVCDIE